MSKILYVKDDLHRRLKIMSTQLNKSMQETTEEAVSEWLSAKENEHKKLAEAFNAIKEKLGPEERSIIESMIASQNAMNVTKKEITIEESKVLEALLAKKNGEQK